MKPMRVIANDDDSVSVWEGHEVQNIISTPAPQTREPVWPSGKALG